MRRDAILLVLLTVALLAPFLGKAFHVDDVLFVWLGQHLLGDPWDFFGFAVNWNGTLEPMHAVTKNPPLAGYFLAGAAALLGFGERGLHLAFLAPAAAAVLGTYFLARRLCGHPLEAALLAATTPVFLVCATSVMSDVSALALFSWTLVAWMAGLERERRGLLVLAGVLAAAAAATKYFAAGAIPLCLAWGLLVRRRPGAWCLPLAIPVAALAAYEWGTAWAYGQGHFLEAALYATEGGDFGKPDAVARALVGASFLGGCILPALFCAPLLWSRRTLIAAAAVAALAAWRLTGFLRPGVETPGAEMLALPMPLGTRLQLVLAVLAGAGLLAAAARDVWQRRDAGAVLLALWVGGVFVFASFLNWTNNGRSILPVVPAAAIVLVRCVESRSRLPRPALAARLRLALAPGLVVALAVTWADARWAGSIRDEARALLARHHQEERPLRFQGHWGFQYYLEQGGARALDARRDAIAQETRIAVLEEDFAAWADGRAPVELLEETEQAEPRWVRTHDWRLGAGFYASVFGPLPFAFGAAPPDRYRVYRATRPFRLGAGAAALEAPEPSLPAQAPRPR
jgi:4-amino-4-deoxy-L-arabinose transferase-like glycosyltransferase